MVFICVICMIKKPPLSPLSAEHRQLLEAIVSPVINTTELKAFKLLHCIYCEKLLQSVYNFQQTALRGVKAFKYLLNKRDGPTAVQSNAFQPKLEAKPNMDIKDEPEIELDPNLGIISVLTTEEINPLSDEIVVKIETLTKPEPVSDCDSASTISCDSCEILAPDDSVAGAAGTTLNPDSVSAEAGTIGSEMKDTVPHIEPNKSASSQVRLLSKKPKQKSQKSKVAITVLQSVQKVQTAKVAPSVKTKILPSIVSSTYASASKAAKVSSKSESFDVVTHKVTQDSQPGQSRLWTPSTNTSTRVSRSEESQSLMSQELESAKNLPYLTSIRWKNGVEEGYIKSPRERKKPEPVSCPICNKVLSSKSCLKSHLSTHGKAIPAECKTCGKMCSSEKALKVHMIRHKMEIKTVDDIKPELFCKQCAMHFPSRSTYKTHLKTLKHTPREQFTWEYLWDKIARELNGGHAIASNKQVSYKQAMEPSKQSFECETCRKKFPSEKRLQDHVDVVHLHKRPHKCVICGNSYGKRKALLVHFRRAHDELPKRKQRTYICHLCGKAFTNTKSLEEHLLCHQGLRPFQCKLCPATFSYSAALYTHNKLKHLKIKGKWKKKKKVEESREVGKESGEGDKDMGEVGKEAESLNIDSLLNYAK